MRKLVSFLLGMLGVAVGVLGWAQAQGVEDVRNLQWWSVSLLLVLAGNIISWLTQSPRDAHWDDGQRDTTT